MGFTERHRNYCFTSFNCDIFRDGNVKFDVWRSKGVKFIVYQFEKCPNTGKEHVQGYAEFSKAMSYKAIKKCFGDNTIHLEVRRGSQSEAIEYCKKDDSRLDGPFEFGDKNVQGARNDLGAIRDAINNGATINDIMDEFPSQFIRYGRGIRDMFNAMFERNVPNFKNVECNILYGDAGTGKTKYVYDKFDANDVYRLRRSNNGTLWFDGYTGQKVLLIDEFYGWITWSDLLEFTDGYKLKLDVKGGFTYKAWDYVYITSNKAPENWYKDFNCMEKNEFKRRINKIVKLECKESIIREPEFVKMIVSKNDNGQLIWEEKKELINDYFVQKKNETNYETYLRDLNKELDMIDEKCNCKIGECCCI